MHDVIEQNQLIMDSELCYGILGRAGEFLLIDLLAPKEATEGLIAEGQEKGYGYCGVLGIKDGVPGAKIQPGYDCMYTCFMASLEFARIVADRLRVPPTGDSVEWLQKLFEMPDTRNPLPPLRP